MAAFGLAAGVISGTVAGLKQAHKANKNPWTGDSKSNNLSTKNNDGGVRTQPTDLSEQLTLEEAKSGQGTEIMRGRINDPKWADWQKMSHTHTTYDGKTIEIHYWRNPTTGETTGFKFKHPPAIK